MDYFGWMTRRGGRAHFYLGQPFQGQETVASVCGANDQPSDLSTFREGTPRCRVCRDFAREVRA